MRITTTLFPPANREAAIVAFLRTIWQVLKGTGFVGGTGYVIVTSAQIAHLNVQTVGIALGAIALSAVLSGAFSAFSILVNGLPASYTASPAVVAAPVVPDAVVTLVTPAELTAPAAGVPPAAPVMFPADPAPAHVAEVAVPPVFDPAAQPLA
jgi:hypothetical protein